MVRPFYLHKRGGIFYCQITNQSTGKALPARSTGETDRDRAVLVAAKWLQEGALPARRREPAPTLAGLMGFDAVAHALRTSSLTSDQARRLVRVLSDRGLLTESKKAGSQPVGDFLTTFWDFDKSPYVAELVAHGRSVGKAHCYNRLKNVEKYWVPALGSKPISEVTRTDLEALSVSLSKLGLVPSTINRVLTAGTTALSWAWRKEMIHVDPAKGLARFSERHKGRGLLTDDEVERLFQVRWTDQRACTAALVCATTGCRIGEVLGLQFEDIADDRLLVRRSYSEMDGLKSTKTGESRVVPLLPQVKGALLDLAAKNPHRSGKFIFWGVDPSAPIYQKAVLRGFKLALESIGVDEAAQKERGVGLHSFRHRWATLMSNEVDARAVGLVTGHKTPKVLEAYAAHVNEKDFQKVAAAVEVVFGSSEAKAEALATEAREAFEGAKRD